MIIIYLEIKWGRVKLTYNLIAFECKKLVNHLLKLTILMKSYMIHPTQIIESIFAIIKHAKSNNK